LTIVLRRSDATAPQASIFVNTRKTETNIKHVFLHEKVKLITPAVSPTPTLSSNSVKETEGHVEFVLTFLIVIQP
jgi:hypothetical protein